MNIHPANRTVSFAMIVVSTLLTVGCEGIFRTHDERVGLDIEPPPDSVQLASKSEELPNFADLVEDMAATREMHVNHLLSLERGYLLAGDTVRANWARRQRELTEQIEIPPYLTDEAPFQSVLVSADESIPEADALYTEAVELFDSFEGIPFMGFTKINADEPRQALRMFQRILSEYPKSDKVDDCAFYCGKLYQEFLRDDDPDNQLALRYYKWAIALDPQTPHPARFQIATVYEYRLHDRESAIEYYHQVLETNEVNDQSNMRWAANRIDAMTDDIGSPIRPREPGFAEDLDADRPDGSPPPVTAQLPEDDEGNDQP